MHIEVAVPSSASSKAKGDLLEDFASELLRTQGYHVVEEVRMTAVELDLLCQHKVNRKQIYVECKAHRTPLSANVLTNILGKVQFKKYQEGWLVSTGPLGKDAKGFQIEWEQKPTEEVQQLSIYTPERVYESFVDASLISPPPVASAREQIEDVDLIGEWTLLVTPYGRHWILSTLAGGVPYGALVFSAKTGQLIRERELLSNISSTDTSLIGLDFDTVFNLGKLGASESPSKLVVEVQQGDSWSDYRPARPEDFVGRKDEQNRVLRYLENVRLHETSTRVFAITGDSGMGKSSLVAKLRARTRNQRYRGKFFIYAVDVRAARDSSYIYSSVLAGLAAATQHGFGSPDSTPLRISSPTSPLASDSIQSYLRVLEEQERVVCVVFDQFEELYSKTPLFNIFDVAQRLLLAVTSVQSNLVLGFAWKSDSTVQQNHPAYYFWHRLADHRLEVHLRRFTHSEASSALTIFERQISSKLRSDLRRQLIENSQGYPWLLKKLSIHVYEQLKDGVSQLEIMSKALDVESLFERDLQQLTKPEDACLKMIARSAPADWYEMLEASDQETLRGLQQKRLIVRSGDRINLYWDIFREYVLTRKAPSIPLTYLPSSPSLRTMLAVAQSLDRVTLTPHAELAELIGISEKTVGNIVRDLTMFGVASGRLSQARLAEEMPSSDPKEVLRTLRRVLRHHALTIYLKRQESAVFVTPENMVAILQEINPAAQHQRRTWKIYADRMGQWLSATGYLIPYEDGWKVEDRGEDWISPTNDIVRRHLTRHPQRYRENALFIGDTSPFRTVLALEWFLAQPPRSSVEIAEAGHRNGARALINLRLIRNQGGKYLISPAIHDESKGLKEIVWRAAAQEPVMELATDYLDNHPTATGIDIGRLVAEAYERKWTDASNQRIGNSLRQWASWLIRGLGSDIIPDPPGRKPKSMLPRSTQLDLDLHEA